MKTDGKRTIVLVKHCRQCPITSEISQGVFAQNVLDDSAPMSLNHCSIFVKK